MSAARVATTSQATTNPLHTSFKNPMFPPNQITPENVLNYFSHPNNPFYDNSCCNAQVRMQNVHRPLEEVLLTLTGIQYVVWAASPPLYVICKLRRNTATDVTPLAYYYVINGVIYQAPDMYAVVQSRLVAAIQPLRAAFTTALQFKRYNVARGYYWDFGTNPEEENQTRREEKPLEQRPTAFHQRRVDQLLQVIYKQFPPIGMSVQGAPTGDTTAAEGMEGESATTVEGTSSSPAATDSSLHKK